MDFVREEIDSQTLVPVCRRCSQPRVLNMWHYCPDMREASLVVNCETPRFNWIITDLRE